MTLNHGEPLSAHPSPGHRPPLPPPQEQNVLSPTFNLKSHCHQFFAIPELFHSLTRHMDRNSIVNSLSVSKTWYRTLLPLVWTEIDVVLQRREIVRPLFQVSKANSSLVHKLALRGQDSLEFTGCHDLLCPNLSVLELDQSRRLQSSFSLFIQRHQKTLTQVKDNRLTTRAHFTALAGCKNLRRLELSALQLEGTQLWISLFESLWSRVESLSLKASIVDWLLDDRQPPLPAPTASETAKILKKTRHNVKIKELAMEQIEYYKISIEAQFWLIQQSPELVRLRWVTRWRERENLPMRLLATAIQSGSCCQRLESIALPCMSFDEVDFATLVQSIARLTELDLKTTNFMTQTWKTLQRASYGRHLTTLRSLDVSGCNHLKGSAIQEMMCSLPNLKVFRARTLSESDILNDGDRPWVCLRLKEICLTFKPESCWTQGTILSRLKELVRLEVLMLGGSDFHLVIGPDANEEKTTKSNVDERTEGDGGRKGDGYNGGGLDLLRTLRRLVVFQWIPNNPPIAWGEPEVQWVLRFWPALKELKGVAIDTKAVDLLKSHVQLK